MKNLQNIVLVTVLVILVSLVGFIVLNKKDTKPINEMPVAEAEPSTPAGSTTTATTTTTDWKTYKNTEYGYEFKYPVDWKLVNYSDGDEVQPPPFVGSNVYFGVSADSRTLSQVQSEFLNVKNEFTIRDIVVGGISAKEYTYKSGKQSSSEVFLSYNNRTYHVSLYRPEINPEAVNTVNKILSTFKFNANENLKVTFPKAGDILVEGQTYKITWTKPTSLSDTSYMIHLENDQVGSILIGETSGTSISWQIPVILGYLGQDGPKPDAAPIDGYRVALTPKNVSLADYESSRIYSSVFRIIPKK